MNQSDESNTTRPTEQQGETPRTDAEVLTWTQFPDSPSEMPPCVPALFARQLERELAQLRREDADNRACIHAAELYRAEEADLRARAEKAERELAEAEKELAVWMKCNRVIDSIPDANSDPAYIIIERLWKQRDEARAQLQAVQGANQDTARLDWLESNGHHLNRVPPNSRWDCNPTFGSPSYETIRSAIDASMLTPPPQADHKT